VREGTFEVIKQCGLGVFSLSSVPPRTVPTDGAGPNRCHPFRESLPQSDLRSGSTPAPSRSLQRSCPSARNLDRRAISVLPTFEDALRSFGDFLVSQGLDRSVGRVFKEDVTMRGRGTPWLRAPLPAENALLVKGLALSVYCTVGRLAYCSAFVPRDQEEAANRMIRGLKMTVPTRVREARLCGKGLGAGLRFVLAGRARSDWVLDEMHSRQEIQARLGVNGSRA
jgi:hypothetical protein